MPIEIATGNPVLSDLLATSLALDTVESLWTGDGQSISTQLPYLEADLADQIYASHCGAGTETRVVVACNTVDDLASTPAIVQLLSDTTLRVSLWLVFPTRAYAQFAEWRLAHLSAFVTITSRDALDLSQVSAEWPFLVVPAQTALPDDFASQASPVLGGQSPAAAIFGRHSVSGMPSVIIAARTEEALRACAAGFASVAWLSSHPKTLDDCLPTTAPATRTSRLGTEWRWEPGSIRLEKLPLPASRTKQVVFEAGDRILASKLVDGDVVLPLPYSVRGRCRIEGRLSIKNSKTAVDLDIEATYPPHLLTPDMVTCYLNRGGAGNPMIQAFAEGLAAPMAYAEDETGPRPGVPLVWGVLRGSDRVIEYARQSGQYWIYVDHAYFSRGHLKNYRVSRNAYDAGPVRQCPSDRLQALDITPQPWNRNGSIIVVCPPTDFFMEAHGCHSWLEDTLTQLSKVTDREIVVRDKPQPGQSVEPLPSVLSRTHALVTHSSNVAVEAVVLGTPVFVSPMSAAAPVGRTNLNDIEQPAYPDRQAWLAHLAYSQFSFDEIRDGTAWRLLMENEIRPLV